MNLDEDESAITESSAVVQWQSPEETGGRGISISSYTVTVSDDAGHQIMSESVSDDGRDGAFSHTISGLDYNTVYGVEVIVNNHCGLTSQPATTTVSIEARGQLKLMFVISVLPWPTLLSLVLSCDVPLSQICCHPQDG